MAEQRLRYFITGNASGLNNALNKASARVSQFGNKMKSVGASLQRFSAIGVLAGGAAIKMGVKFDESMTKIKSLVGIAGDEVDAMGGKVRELAKQTGVSSTEAADALFFITSAGLRGSEAMEALEASLKASASGLGETKTIADLATSAMNAYGSDTLSASGATDILTAAVREGKLESSELAGSMGQVLPVASAMGVSFNDVGAAMAAMSRTGTPAAQAATQLTAIMAGLLKPTTQAEQALATMGLSSSGLKEQIREEGLLSVLGTLKERFDANSDAAAQVFPNIRALKGVLDLTGSGAEQAGEIFKSMNNTLGDSQKAFDETSKSASFRLKKSLNAAKESFAEMGAVLLEALLPMLQGLANIVKNIFTAFNNLDGGTQKLIAAFGVVLIALPTLISLFGTLTTIVGALLSPIGLIAAALAGVAYIIYQNWSEVAPVVVGLYNQFVDLYNSSESLRKIIFGVGAAFKTVFIGIKTIVMEFVNVFQTMWKLIKAFSEDGFDASFGDILQEGFDNGKKIALDGADEIGKAFTDGFDKAVGSKLEHKTVDQLNNGISNAIGTVKNKFKGWLGDVLSLGGGGEGAGEPVNDSDSIAYFTSLFKGLGSEENQEAVGQTTEKVGLLKETLDAVANSAEVVGEGIKGAFLGAFEAMMEGENVFKALGQMLLALIKKLIAAALAAFVLSALVKSIFPSGGGGDMFKGMGDFKKLFTSFSGVKFAKGGIVSTPTMGLMGEYPGARSNPEVIAPLDKLQGMLGQTGGGQVQVGGEFRIKGQDLVVALQRAERNRNRIK